MDKAALILQGKHVMTSNPKYKVADLSLAEFGRKEIAMAEIEMPGLTDLRARFG